MTTPADDEEPVPRLPRGRGMKLDGAMMVRLATTLVLLIMIIVMARPCANATSKFVTGFGDQGSAGSASSDMPRPGTVDLPSTQLGSDQYERLGPNMTEAEIKAAIERAKQKAAGASATGSAAN